MFPVVDPSGASRFEATERSKSISIKILYNYIIINFMFSQFSIFEEFEDGNYAISQKLYFADVFILLQVAALKI